MEEWIIRKKDDGKRLDAFFMEKKNWGRAFFMKALRTNKIKVNGRKETPAYRMKEGDVLRSFVLEKEKKEIRPVTILYEDENILAVDKPAGLLSLDVTGKEKDTLLDRVNLLMEERKEGKVYPVHRIDFNTSGILLLAKDKESAAILETLIRERKVHKSYFLVVRGDVKPSSGRLTHYLFKDAKKNQVYVSDEPVKGAKTAVLDYEKKGYRDGLSLVECHLITGRTHQIRSQMAHMGHPLLGDDKYGSKEWNKKMGERRQLLCAWKITFDFKEGAGKLSYLSGKTIHLSKISFVTRYFKGIPLI